MSVVGCSPESENGVAANDTVHDEAGKYLLVSVVALHLRCESQLLCHLESHFGQSADCAEYGALLQRHEAVLCSAISGTPACMNARRERQWAWRSCLTDQFILAHSTVNAFFRLQRPQTVLC